MLRGGQSVNRKRLPTRVGLEMGFFRDFGLNKKIPKSRGSGSGIKNPYKIPSEKSRKSRNPVDQNRDVKTSKKNPEKIPSANSRKTLKPRDRDLNLKISKTPEIFIPRDLNFGILVPGIRNFSGFFIFGISR